MSKTQDAIIQRKKRHGFTRSITTVTFCEIEKHLKGCQGGVNISISTGKGGRDRFFTISKRRDKIIIRIFNNGNVDILISDIAYENFRISLFEYEGSIDTKSADEMLRKGIELFISTLLEGYMHYLMDFMADTCLGAKWEDCMDQYLKYLHDNEPEES